MLPLMFVSVAARAQTAPPTVPVLTVADMHADLAYLRAKMLGQHPHPFLYIRKPAFDALYASIYHDLDGPLPRNEFYRRAARLASALKDGHTLVEPLIEEFGDYAARGGVVPFEVTFVGKRLYVASNASDDARLTPGTEITAINGMSVDTVVNDYRGLINDVQPLYDVYARLFRELYWLRFGAAPRFEIRFRTGGGTVGTARVTAHVYPADAFHSYKPAGERFAFRLLENNVGLLTINSFSPDKSFDAFIEKSFVTLKAARSPALIIDVRRNGGGSGRLAQEVISYLTDKPYRQIGAFYVKVTDDLKALYREGTSHTDEDTRRIVEGNPAGALVDGLKDTGPLVATPPRRDALFGGKTWLLTANNTFSAAAMFAAYVKCNGLGIVVGETPGQSTNFVADAVPFVMPKSGLRFGVSFSEIHMPCQQSYYRGISPDVPVKPTASSLAAGRDPVLDAALAEIARSALR